MNWLSRYRRCRRTEAAPPMPACTMDPDRGSDGSPPAGTRPPGRADCAPSATCSRTRWCSCRFRITGRRSGESWAGRCRTTRTGGIGCGSWGLVRLAVSSFRVCGIEANGAQGVAERWERRVARWIEQLRGCAGSGQAVRAVRPFGEQREGSRGRRPACRLRPGAVGEAWCRRR
jgi:hypothetical protein